MPAERQEQFFTEAGVRVPAVTAEEMREVDLIAIERTGPNLYQMMENAGRELALLAMEKLGSEWKTKNIVVLAGGGGNGGGGICAARHLANRCANVTLCLATAGRLGEVPAFQLKIYRGTPGFETGPESLNGLKPDLVLDALIGYSLRSAPKGVVAGLIRWANNSEAPILSLDIPSGVDATSGETPGEWIKARWTMTLALPKTGLLPEKTGDLILADIGIPEEAYTRLGLAYFCPFDAHSRVRLHLLDRSK